MKTAIVTGAGVRLGKEFSDFLLQQDYHLILCAHQSFKDLEAWTTNHPQKNQIKALVKADLAKTAGIEKIVQMAKQEFQHLDLLLNNASIYHKESFLDISSDSFDKMQNINFKAPFFLTQKLFSLLSSSKNPSVVNVIDALWNRPYQSYSHYFISKAALWGMTKALAKELAPKVRVNGLAPGIIMFPNCCNKELQEKLLLKVPQQRLGSSKNLCESLLFLVEKTDYITGEIINVDGGLSI